MVDLVFKARQFGLKYVVYISDGEMLYVKKSKDGEPHSISFFANPHGGNERLTDDVKNEALIALCKENHEKFEELYNALIESEQKAVSKAKAVYENGC